MGARAPTLLRAASRYSHVPYAKTIKKMMKHYIGQNLDKVMQTSSWGSLVKEEPMLMQEILGPQGIKTRQGGQAREWAIGSPKQKDSKLYSQAIKEQVISARNVVTADGTKSLAHLGG